MIVDNVLDLIGNTPMLRLKRISSNSNVEMYLKLEKFNPGGSVKDRIAKYMIEHAEADSVLTQDKIVIEPTSGNTGIGLAIVCAVKGYKLVLVMPETKGLANGVIVVMAPDGGEVPEHPALRRRQVPRLCLSTRSSAPIPLMWCFQE